ncbi:MAG: hypothetical protein D6725_17195, partial [Planctomycetota bacterium]
MGKAPTTRTSHRQIRGRRPMPTPWSEPAKCVLSEETATMRCPLREIWNRGFSFETRTLLLVAGVLWIALLGTLLVGEWELMQQVGNRAEEGARATARIVARAIAGPLARGDYHHANRLLRRLLQPSPNVTRAVVRAPDGSVLLEYRNVPSGREEHRAARPSDVVSPDADHATSPSETTEASTNPGFRPSIHWNGPDRLTAEHPVRMFGEPLGTLTLEFWRPMV